VTLNDIIVLTVPVVGLLGVAAFVYWQNERDGKRDLRK
jgi:hypothetical protein